jgi:predicted dithiol-disulfide oxidoreductase (DUF899 family)
MGWTVPWFSSAGTDFNDDFGVTTAEGENFGLSVFLRESDSVFHTHFTTGRRSARRQLYPARYDPVWTAGGMGGLTRRMAANPALRVVRRHDEY